MGYLGNEPTTGHFPVQTNLVGPGPTYTLDRAPATAGAIEVSVQGVLQPTTAYSVSGTTLTMAGVTSGIPIFIRYLGETLTIQRDVIANDAVTTATIANDAVTIAKLAATGTASSSTFLRGDNSWQTAGSTSASDLTSGTLPIARIANDAIDSIHYAASSIDEEHIAADAVNFATHLKAGTDGELITWDASGNPAAVSVGSSGQVLTSGGTGVAPTFAAAAGGGLTLGTEVSSATSQQGYTFSGIPSGTTMIIMTFEGVSMSASSQYAIQLGDSGGLETSGYSGSAVKIRGSSGTSIGGTSPGIGHIINGADSAALLRGFATGILKDASANTWVWGHSISTQGYPNDIASFGGSSKSLSGELTQIRLDTTGADTFDAGSINIAYM